ncbi:hypothetical protein [Streptomyces sp. DH8]|uniref:hypothetical protein n=1 Tax=Streptomyces sp. DH8 TaxID=2857008 RepID=UPI001E375A4D|nr:hypothetical protein [Streptomyces sp. DH8]
MAAAWLVRDFRVVEGPGMLWGIWSGTANPWAGPSTATTATTLLLLIVHAATAVVALRSALAAPALITTGIVTFAVRLPGVWTLADSPAPEDLRGRALLTTYAALVAGAAMVVVGAAGRRPAADGEERPAGPGRGAGVAAFLLLGFQAAVFAGWEIRQIFVYPDYLYPAWFTGGKPLTIPWTEAPPGWLNSVLVVLFLVAAVGAVAGATFARPLGLIAGGFLLSSGALGVGRFIRFEMYERFATLGLEEQLNLLSFFTSLIAGAALLAVLARKGGRRAPGGTPSPWGGSGPWGVQPPGYPPPGVPGQPGTWQPPAQAPGSGPAPAPGSGFGPPPASPPPRW